MWPSVARELLAMATAVPYMECRISAPLAPVLLASDAEGSNGTDHGGFGVVAALADPATVRAAFERGFTPVRALAGSDGQVRGLDAEASTLERRVPHSSLPASIVASKNLRWVPICWGDGAGAII